MLPRRYFRTDLINWNPAIEAVDEYIYVQQGSASVQYKSEYKRTARFQVLPREALSGTFQFILWMLWFYPRLVKSEFEVQNEKVGSIERQLSGGQKAEVSLAFILAVTPSPSISLTRCTPPWIPSVERPPPTWSESRKGRPSNLIIYF